MEDSTYDSGNWFRPRGRKSNAYQIFILVLTVLSLAIMVWLLMPISEQTRNLLNWYDNAICFIFLYDFTMNMLDARKNKTNYFIKERGWLDKINVNYADENFLRTYGMTIVEGRDFSEGMRNGTENVVILNETAAGKIGWKEPLGRRLRYNVDYRSRTVGGATVVGVVRDFHFLSLHHPVGPIMLRLIPRDEGGNIVSVKVAPDNIADSIASIEKAFKSFFPDGSWSYRFLDEDFQQRYLEERKAGQVVTVLALMAVLIACLGLFGLSSYMTKQRVREIGIRKVMSARHW